MAAFCHFWRITPSEFWSLELAEHKAMVRYMERYAEHNKTRHPRRR